MLVRLVSLSAALAIAGAPPALAKDDNSASETKPDPDKIVCKSVRELGSRIPVRICHSRADWEQIARETQEAMRARSGSSGCNDGGGPC